MNTEPQKCNGFGCSNVGEPEEGFDFFFCADCGEELERALEAEGAQRAAIHGAN